MHCGRAALSELARLSPPRGRQCAPQPCPISHAACALVPRTRSSHNFAESLDANFGLKKRHYRDGVASVLIDSEVRTSGPQLLTNFGIGTLAAWHPSR